MITDRVARDLLARYLLLPFDPTSIDVLTFRRIVASTLVSHEIETLEQAKDSHITAVLAHTNGNVSQAARILNVARTLIQRRRRRR